MSLARNARPDRCTRHAHQYNRMPLTCTALAGSSVALAWQCQTASLISPADCVAVRLRLRAPCLWRRRLRWPQNQTKCLCASPRSLSRAYPSATHGHAFPLVRPSNRWLSVVCMLLCSASFLFPLPLCNWWGIGKGRKPNAPPNC